MNDRYDELSQIWFKRAQEDLAWVKHNFEGKFYGIVCFGCQQIAEKALKAYLFSQKEKLVRTHNLLVLLNFCLKHDSSFEQLAEACKILNDYYSDTRYPDIWDYDRFEDERAAKEAIVLAQEVLNFIKAKLKKEKTL